MKINKSAVINNFNRAASVYDKNAVIQYEAGNVLLSHLKKKRDIHTILDVGCGTGSITARLSELFPQAHIHAIDLSPNMIDEARKKNSASNITYSVSDIERYTEKESYDIIFSNCAFQWIEDLPGMYNYIQNLLNDDSIFIFSYVFDETYSELKTIFSKINNDLHFEERITFPEMLTLLDDTFTVHTTESRREVMTFSSLSELLITIRNT
jgi:malonyl-CoA O-methyltransferase